jgi:tetratricopeptide (TPR) repeat protein
VFSAFALLTRWIITGRLACLSLAKRPGSLFRIRVTLRVCVFAWCFCFLLIIARAQTASPSSPNTPQASSTAGFGPQAGAGLVAGNTGPGEPRTPDPALAPARSLLKEGKLTDAEAATRNYLQAHADSADAHFLLGFILFREIQGKWLEAENKNGVAIRYSTGDVNGSLVEYRDAKVKQSLAEYTAGAKYHVPNAFDLKIVALDYILLKDYIDADHWLTRSLQWDSRDAQAWYYLGRTKYSESQFPKAIEAFEQCLKLEAKNVQAETNVGLSYEALGQSNEAIQAFENAVAWESAASAKDPEPFIELAHLYLNENHPEKAVPYLSQAIAIFPKASKAHEALGRAYSLLHRLPEAQAELQQAVALEPTTASLRCMLGQIYRQEQMISEAKAEFDRCAALQQTPSEKPPATQ